MPPQSRIFKATGHRQKTCYCTSRPKLGAWKEPSWRFAENPPPLHHSTSEHSTRHGPWQTAPAKASKGKQNTISCAADLQSTTNQLKNLLNVGEGSWRSHQWQPPMNVYELSNHHNHYLPAANKSPSWLNKSISYPISPHPQKGTPWWVAPGKFLEAFDFAFATSAFGVAFLFCVGGGFRTVICLILWVVWRLVWRSFWMALGCFSKLGILVGIQLGYIVGWFQGRSQGCCSGWKARC